MWLLLTCLFFRLSQGENGIAEKSLEELKQELEMEENDGLSPTSAHKKASTLRQVGNPNRATSGALRGGHNAPNMPA